MAMKGFWTAAAKNSDPKRAYRFKLTFAQNGGLIWYAKKVTKPKFAITETPHTYLNHKFYFPGRVEWAEVTATLIDPDTVINDLMHEIEAGGYTVPSNENTLSTLEKQRSLFGDIHIDQINADGGSLERWTLRQAWIKDFTQSDLDYEADELSTIDITFRYDWAELDSTNFVPE